MSAELIYTGIMGVSLVVAPEFAPFVLLGGGLLFIFLFGDKA
jgi:hypothetical protein